MSDCDHVWAIFGIGAEARPGRCLKCGAEWEHPEIAALRTRLQAAEAERDALREAASHNAVLRCHVDALELDALRERDRATKAEAEVARLRGAVAAVRARAIDTRNGYIEGATLVGLVDGPSIQRCHAGRMLDGPIGALNTVIGALHDILAAPAAEPAGKEPYTCRHCGLSTANPSRECMPCTLL